MKKRNLLKSIAIISTIIFISGCVNKSSLPRKSIGLQVNSPKEGTIAVKEIEGIDDSDECYGYGIYTPDGDYLHDRISNHGSTEDIIVKFHLSNDLGENHVFTLVVLDNYKQIPFVIDNQEGKNYSVELANKNETDIPINLGKMNAGRHDVVFLVFVDAIIQPAEDSVIVGNSAIRAIFIIDSDNSYTNPVMATNVYSESDDDSLNLQVSDNDEYELSISSSDEDQITSIIVFDNYEEIESYTINLKSKTKTVIPFSYHMPSDSATHVISAVALSNADGSENDTPITSKFSDEIWH